MISKEEIWTALEEIPDPEIPVISINELGVLREIKKEPSGFVITITPTYSGCPAMNQIETDIKPTKPRCAQHAMLDFMALAISKFGRGCPALYLDFQD